MNNTTRIDIAASPERDSVGLGLGPKQNPTTEDRRAALPRDAVESTVSKPQNKGHKSAKNNTPPPAVPASAIRVAKIGGTIALGAAAAISAQSLISLGHLLGLHGRVAWLLPTSLDVYAATSIWVGYRIPAAHPASAIARRGACLALILSVCCNALYHLLLLAGHQLPTWLTDGLLVLVGALPPLVVERIFHLQMAVRNGNDAASAEVSASASVSAPISRKASADPAGSASRKPAPHARASGALPAAPGTGSTAASGTGQPVPAGGSAAAARQAASGPIPIQRGARLEMIRDWISGAGGDPNAVPLKQIQERFGVSQATASRMRSDAVTAADNTGAATPGESADDDPEQALEAIS